MALHGVVTGAHTKWHGVVSRGMASDQCVPDFTFFKYNITYILFLGDYNARKEVIVEKI